MQTNKTTQNLAKLGFEKNTTKINGKIPHFKKGKDVLFFIGKDYWPGKLYGISRAFEKYPGKVYGVMTENAPRNADWDWVAASNLTLLSLNPLAIGQWKKDKTGIEFAKPTFKI